MPRYVLLREPTADAPDLEAWCVDAPTPAEALAAGPPEFAAEPLYAVEEVPYVHRAMLLGPGEILLVIETADAPARHLVLAYVPDAGESGLGVAPGATPAAALSAWSAVLDADGDDPDGLTPFVAGEIAWQTADPDGLAPLGDGVPGARLDLTIDDEVDAVVVAVPVRSNSRRPALPP